ncbi:uncharacterized protein LOC129001847 [Macrosteles quadrilineatus]|uniref:uncharacterized protein LOC129001847 n=1 Tax=Macrosteles quadrilineatus TaxID=74068 RepID=UPI0023E2EAA1|nr:uncharacterized protein LOC129001847 [Macrosteles quadrilineatus]
MSTYEEIMKYYGKKDALGNPMVPPAKLKRPPDEFPDSGSNIPWELPDWPYSRERYEEQWKRYQMCLEFEKKSNFDSQSMMFLSDYPEIVHNYYKNTSDNEDEPEPEPEKKEEEEKEDDSGGIIQLTRPPDFDDLMYVINNYDYDPDDDVVNNYNDDQAENFIRSKIIEYRKSIGKQI